MGLWNVTPRRAIRLQQDLAGRIIPRCSLKKITRVAGADVAFDAERNEGVAGVIVYSFPALEPLERVSARSPVDFPYVPGLLSFREGPLLLKALGRLKTDPDVLI